MLRAPRHTWQRLLLLLLHEASRAGHSIVGVVTGSCLCWRCCGGCAGGWSWYGGSELLRLGREARRHHAWVEEMAVMAGGPAAGGSCAGCLGR